MTPPDSRWRAWIYGLCMLAGGVVFTGYSIWLVVLIRWDWPAGTEAQRLGILGNALIGTLAGAGLVLLGLVVRSNIRTLKGSAGADGVSFEAQSHRDDGPGDESGCDGGFGHEGEDDLGPAGSGGDWPAGGLGDLGGGDPAGAERGGRSPGERRRDGRGRRGGKGGRRGADRGEAFHGEGED